MKIFDEAYVSLSENFEAFRERHFNFLYFCKNCKRSFDSASQEEACRFCNGPIMELKSKKTMNKVIYYRYYCPTCEKNFTTTEKLAVCSGCRTNFLHFYTWNMLSRKDRFYIKLRKAINNVFLNRVNPRNLKLRLDASKHSINMPSFSFSRCTKEELPTY